MDKLPKVYVNKCHKDFRNSQEQALVDEQRAININDVLSNNTYSFNHKYLITLNNGQEYRSSIISNNGTQILTIDNNLININEIKSIREIKK